MLTARKKKRTPQAFLVSLVVHVAIAGALTAIVVEEHLQEKDVDTKIDVHVDPPKERGPVVRRERREEHNPAKLHTPRNANLRTPDVNTNRSFRPEIEVPSGGSDLIQGPSEIPDISPRVNVPGSPSIGSVDVNPPKIDNSRPIDNPPPKTNLQTPGLTTIIEGNVTPDKQEYEVDKDYDAELRKKIMGKQTYPAFARAANLEGVTKIRFVLKRDGTLVTSEIEESSGHKSLDNAALQSVKRAAPFPPFPIAQKGDELSITVPIVFELR